MTHTPSIPNGAIAVIFSSFRTAHYNDDYQRDAEQMEKTASEQSGYLHFMALRGDDNFGIAISYWADIESAKKWRDHPEHAKIRQSGRDKYYSSYSIQICEVQHDYSWRKTDDG